MKLKKRLPSAAALTMALAVAPAAAQAGDTVVFEDSVTFPDIDPCTGDPMSVSLDFVITERTNRKATVIQVERSGSIDTGYQYVGGTQTVVMNPNNVVNGVTDMWAHPDGRRIRALVTVVIDLSTGTPRVLRTPPDTLRCVGGATIGG